MQVVSGRGTHWLQEWAGVPLVGGWHGWVGGWQGRVGADVTGVLAELCSRVAEASAWSREQFWGTCCLPLVPVFGGKKKRYLRVNLKLFVLLPDPTPCPISVIFA